jgi:hypothetical protein
VVPLSFNNNFAHFIFRNKVLDKVAYTPVIVCFLVAGFIMLAIAVYMFAAMATVKEMKVQYYSPQGSSCVGSGTCSIVFTVGSTMRAPVYLLYRLD